MKYILISIFLIAGTSAFSQTSNEKISDRLNYALENADNAEQLLVWVFFKDKGANTADYLANPISVVSEKSLNRRSKVKDSNKLISEMDVPVNQQYINQLKEIGFTVKQRSKWFNGVSGYLNKQQIKQASSFNFVKQVDIVIIYKKNNELEQINESKDESKNIENFNKSNKVNVFDYGPSFTQLNQIKVPDLHNMGYTGAGITICSMDAGFDNLTHEVFSSMNIIAMWDFVDNDPDVSGHPHGTATLSTLGGFKEGQLIGPAFGADFILARTEYAPTETPIEEDNWIAALEWADSIGVDVTSTSLTYLEFDPPFQSYTWEDMDGNTMRITIAADLAVKLGIYVVNSASNEGFHPTHNTLWGPADGDSVVSVGAVTSSGVRVDFSSVGPTVDGRIKPDLMAMGSNVYVAGTSSTTSYGTSSGTSFSCPILAGASALLLQVDPTLTPMELLDLLRSTASQSSNPDRLMGWGIIDVLAAANLLITNVEDENLPENYYILRNYPNPFNPSTKIQFAVPQKSDVKLTLHNILGQELQVLFDGNVEAGIQELSFSAGNLPSGIYIVQMSSQNHTNAIKISLLK